MERSGLAGMESLGQEMDWLGHQRLGQQWKGRTGLYWSGAEGPEWERLGLDG